MKAAVVGHVEWVDFARVERVPGPGEIVTALESWSEAGGGGSVTAGEFGRLGAQTTFFTAFGADDVGARAEAELRGRGLRLESVLREAPQRRAFTFVDGDGERAITVMGEKLVPHAGDPLAWSGLDSTDAVYFCGGDPLAVQHARRARVLVATARELPTLRAARVELDVLIHSGRDGGERFRAGELDPAPRLVVTTEGPKGGRYAGAVEEGRWAAVPLPAPLEDTYGAGDCFAAALAFALAEGRSTADALGFAAERAALAITRRGANG
jgi:ribokinase